MVEANPTEVSVTAPLTGNSAEIRLGPEDSIEEGHQHFSSRANWIRAGVLGATDGLVTVGALVVGISAASTSQHQILLSAVAAAVSGALSMAVGEYVSVDQQADTERADVEKEAQAQQAGPEVQARELEELTRIYEERGLHRELAEEVAKELTAKDAVRAHARDELNIDVDAHPSAVQAATSSAISFTVGASIPTLMLLLPSHKARQLGVLGAVIVSLIVFGATSAHLGGANSIKGAIRLLIGGSLALILTYGVGHLFKTDV